MVSNGIIKKILTTTAITTALIITTSTSTKANNRWREWRQREHKNRAEMYITPKEHKKIRENPKYYTKIKLTSQWGDSYGNTCKFKIVNHFLYGAERICQYYKKQVGLMNEDINNQNLRTFKCIAGEGIYYPEAQKDIIDQREPQFSEVRCHRWCNLYVPKSISDWENIKNKYDKEKKGHTATIPKAKYDNIWRRFRPKREHIVIRIEGEKENKQKHALNKSARTRHLTEFSEKTIEELGGIEKIRVTSVFIRPDQRTDDKLYGGSLIISEEFPANKNNRSDSFANPLMIDYPFNYDIIWDEPENCSECQEIKDIKPKIWNNKEILPTLTKTIREKLGTDSKSRSIKQIANSAPDEAECGKVNIFGKEYNDCMAAGLLKVMKYPIIIKLLMMTFKKI